MTEKEPIEITNAYYYLRLASNGLQPIFSEQSECDLMLSVLDKLYNETNTSTLAYCLMTDSIHLVIHVDELLSEQVADKVISTYTSLYNARHKRNGSVFDDSLVSTLIEPNRYLLAVVAKTHNAPVNAGLVAHAAAYPWSSHRTYLMPDCPDWLRRDEVLRYSTGAQSSRYRRFQDYVEQTPPDNLDWVNGNHPDYYALSSRHYIDKRMKPNTPNSRQGHSLSIEGLCRLVCREYHIQPSDLLLWRHHRLGVEVKGVIAHLATSFALADIGSLAAMLKIDPELLTSSVNATEQHREMFLYRLRLRLEKHFMPVRPADSQAQDMRLDQLSDVRGHTNNLTTRPNAPRGKLQDDQVLADDQASGKENSSIDGPIFSAPYQASDETMAQPQGLNELHPGNTPQNTIASP
ncbi:transposase [Aurantivibrio plasticivorans]